MKTVYRSVEELLSGCSSSKLKIHILSVLSCNKSMQWELMSCSEEDDVCRANFISKDEALGAVSYLSSKLNKAGHFCHITVEALMPTAAKV